MDFASLFLGASAAMLATSLGAAAILLFKSINKRTFSALLAFSAGVMAYSIFEMIGEARLAGDSVVIAGALTGVAVLFACEKIVPHVHLLLKKTNITQAKKKAALLAGTISLHNIPEGLAIASAFAGSTPLGWIVTASIALQDAPEGFLVSAPLAGYGVNTNRAFSLGILSGVIEFAAAIAGFFLLSSIIWAIPFALSFSAGAMAFVILAELLPDAINGGFKRVAAVSFVLGTATAFGLASLLGV
ncbi:MAG: ZIP family metal transporter [Candidatus Micrarchaeota archaeon]